MKKGIMYLLLSIVLLSGCTNPNIMKLNDAIVKANDELRVASEAFNKKFEAITDQNYTVLETERKKMADLISTKIAAVSALKADMPGGEDFRSAFTDYYKFEKDIYDTEFKQICAITGNGDADKLSEIGAALREKATRESSMEKNIHTEQEKFAKANKLKLNY